MSRFLGTVPKRLPANVGCFSQWIGPDRIGSVAGSDDMGHDPTASGTDGRLSDWSG